MSLVEIVLDTLNLRERLSTVSLDSSPQVLKTCVRRLADDQLIEWDCLHESEGVPKDDDEDASISERADDDEDQSMEDLTEEAKEDGTQSAEMDGSGSSEEGGTNEEGGDEKGEKAENNSCISMYFQSKQHDLKVRSSALKL